MSWTPEECALLCKSVQEIGGKIPKWTYLIQEKCFPDRTIPAINSQYNNLLRVMSPLIDPDVLEAERERRKVLKQVQVKRIANNERPPLGVEKTYVPFMEDRSYLFKQIFWAKSWPSITIPPNFEFPSHKSVSELGEKLEKNQILVFRLGVHHDFKIVDIDDLESWSSDLNAEKHRNDENESAIQEAEMIFQGYCCDDIVNDILTTLKKREFAKPFSGIMLDKDFAKLVEGKLNRNNDRKDFIQIVNEHFDEETDDKDHEILLLTWLKAIFMMQFEYKKEIMKLNLADHIARIAISSTKTTTKNEELKSLATQILQKWDKIFQLNSS